MTRGETVSEIPSDGTLAPGGPGRSVEPPYQQFTLLADIADLALGFKLISLQPETIDGNWSGGTIHGDRLYTLYQDGKEWHAKTNHSIRYEELLAEKTRTMVKLQLGDDTYIGRLQGDGHLQWSHGAVWMRAQDRQVVAEVVKHGWAQCQGVSLGDELLSVNQKAIAKIPTQDLQFLMRRIRPLSLTFARGGSQPIPPGTKPTIETASKKAPRGAAPAVVVKARRLAEKEAKARGSRPSSRTGGAPRSPSANPHDRRRPASASSAETRQTRGPAAASGVDAVRQVRAAAAAASRHGVKGTYKPPWRNTGYYSRGNVRVGPPLMTEPSGKDAELDELDAEGPRAAERFAALQRELTAARENAARSNTELVNLYRVLSASHQGTSDAATSSAPVAPPAGSMAAPTHEQVSEVHPEKTEATAEEKARSMLTKAAEDGSLLQVIQNVRSSMPDHEQELKIMPTQSETEARERIGTLLIKSVADDSLQSAVRTTRSTMPEQDQDRASALPCEHASERYSWADRLSHLREFLTSTAVREQVATESEQEVPAVLSAEEVATLFVDNVPGVREFLYRQQAGVHALQFITSAYLDGLTFFQGTDLHDHLTWLLRLIVHSCKEGRPDAAKLLREVAEAFMDCQAVQARVIERVGLQMKGLSHDFQSYMVALTAEYKAMALKMLAYEEVVKFGGPDGTYDPAHYENLLLIHIGENIGFSEAVVRQAHLDKHAKQRFMPLNEAAQQEAIARFRGLFDLDAMLKAVVAELNSFSEASEAGSPARLFLDWASYRMKNKHIVFDEETCTRIEVDEALALAILEAVFVGQPKASPEDMYREERLCHLFLLGDEALTGGADVIASGSHAEIGEVVAQSEEP